MSSKIWALCQMFFMIFNRKGCWFFCGCTHHVLLSCRSLYSSISWDTSVSCSVHSPSFECAANASRNPESLLLLLLFCLCCCFQFVLLFSVLFFFFFCIINLLLDTLPSLARALCPCGARHSSPLALGCLLFTFVVYSSFCFIQFSLI